MESRKSEIENLVAGFTASIMNLIGQYRQKHGAFQVPQFAEAVERERARMDKKFAALLADPSCADLGHEIHIVQLQVNQIADGEIARAKAGGKVEFSRQL